MLHLFIKIELRVGQLLLKSDCRQLPVVNLWKITVIVLVHTW